LEGYFKNEKSFLIYEVYLTLYVYNIRFIYLDHYTLYINLVTMAQKPREKTRYAELNAHKSGFVSRMIGSTRDHDFSDVKLLRTLISNEKSRILHLLKHQKPRSIYALAKLLGRDFASVRKDLQLLERFGFIGFVSETKGKRARLVPELSVDKLTIQITI